MLGAPLVVWKPDTYPKIHQWFTQEVLSGRIWDGVFRSVLLSCALQWACLSAALVACAPLSPAAWIRHPLASVLAPSAWFYDAVIIAAIVATALLFQRNFSLVPTQSWSIVLSNGSSMTSLGLHFVLAGIMVRCYLGLFGGPYSTFITKCQVEGDRYCLNEPHVFLVMAGFYFGLSLWYRLHLNNENLLIFPPVNLRGSTQLKLKFWELICKSVRSSFDLSWFYLFYFIYGIRFTQSMAQSFQLELSTPFESWMLFLWSSVCKFAYSIVLCVVLNVTVRLVWEVNRIGFRKPLQLTMDEMVAAMTQKKGTGSELLRHLAFQDFLYMAMRSQARRADVFRLSQPGGHPHNWNKVSGAALSAIDDFIVGLNEASSASNNNASLQNPKQEDTPSATTKKSFAILNRSYIILIKVLEKIKLFLLSSQPEEVAKAKFAESQVILWASEGLSYLASASAFEDQYGVIQKSLHQVLITLLNLQKTVERHRGLTSHPRRSRYTELSSEEELSRDHQLKQELRVSIRTSLYRICATFGESIYTLPLSPEHKQKLESYRNYTEGRP